ncbi:MULTISPECIES: alpha/beta fold hydrolase [unclassified Paenibacillus]|uniref:alpha/beta fold hydrolase n=1 Tax=unclassified Paenibacillus TaxID=185978 RepID=UPI003639370F
MPMVELNGTQIHYQIEGNGVPIVCIHPPMISSNCFTYLRQQLADTFQIITFDIRGHGASEPSERKVTYPLIVGDIRQLLDALHLPSAYLCGYSTGGSVALQAMLTYPDRFLGGILLSSMPEMSDWYNRAWIWAATQVSRLKGKHLMAAVMSAGNADKMQTFKRLYRQAIQGHIRNSQEYFEYSLNFNCTKRLHEIDSPIQLIYGQKDRRFHRYAHMLKRNLAQSTLQFIANANHQLPIKNGVELSGMIRSWIELAEDERWRDSKHRQVLTHEYVDDNEFESQYDLENEYGNHNEQLAHFADEEFTNALEAQIAELSEQQPDQHEKHEDY